MKGMKTQSLLLSICMLLSTPAFAQMSVWEQSKAAAAYTVQGTIESVTADEDSREVLIQLRNDNPASVNALETLRICSDNLGGTKEEFFKRTQMDLIRDAKSKGTKVRISYGSPFNSCVSRVTLLSESSIKGS